MKMFFTFFLLSLMFAEQGFTASIAVVGPSSGDSLDFPSDSSGGLDLIAKQYDVLLKNKATDQSAIEKLVFNYDIKDQKLSCKYDQENAAAMNIAAGNSRLNLISGTVPMLSNPDMSNHVGPVDNSQSIGMFTASETFGASLLSSNEGNSAIQTNSYIKRCDDLNKQANGAGELQLYPYGCMIYQVVNHLNDLFADSDALYQKSVELNMVLNQSMSENIIRETAISTEKEKIKSSNKELTTILDKVKKAKEDQKKAVTALKKAEDDLIAAKAVPCKKTCDPPGSTNNCVDDCTDRDAAVKAATDIYEKAKLAKLKADADLDAATKELIKYLKDKMSYETGIILALLSGTAHGDVAGNDIHFKVNGSDYTLIDSDKAVEDMITAKGYHGHWGRYKEENPNGTQSDFMGKIEDGQVNDYFSKMANNLNDNKDSTKEYYSLLGDHITADQSHLSYSSVNSSSSSNSIGMTLDKFSQMGSNGSNNIETIAAAVSDYQANANNKNLTHLENMKTPQSRINLFTQKLDENKQLNEKIRIMITNNICYMDVMLNMYRKTYESLGGGVGDKAPVSDPFLLYLYGYSASPYKKKFMEGYVSSTIIKEEVKSYQDHFMSSKGLNGVPK